MNTFAANQFYSIMDSSEDLEGFLLSVPESFPHGESLQSVCIKLSLVKPNLQVL